MMAHQQVSAVILLSAVGFWAVLRAEGAGEIVYPPNSGVFNVVTDGGVDNTGATDVTEKLQKILYDGTNATGRRLQVIYFPKGTYLVSGMLKMKIDISRTETSHSHGPWLVGESRAETIIRLKEGTWPKPVCELKPDADGRWPKRLEEQVVLSTGDCTNTTFNKIIRNLTIRIGADNAGTIGVQYNTSNTGTLSDVDIISEDGQGVAGLALAGVENGPGQIRNVTIRGFDVGIYNVTSYVIASSDVTIDGARRVGLLNKGITAGEDFVINMAGADAPAIRNVKNGEIAMIGGKFTGSARQPAIVNEGTVYLRDIETTGFAKVLEGEKNAAGGKLAEYWTGTGAGLFFDARASLRLPIRKTPSVPYEKDFAKWSNPMDYGAVGDGKADDSDAVQKALDEPGKTHVVFPYGKQFRIKKPLTLGKDIVRLVGTHGLMPFSVDDNASLTIGDGASPVVVIEGLTKAPPIYVRTNRTVVLDSVRVKADQPQMPKAPPGQPKNLPPAKYFTVGYYLEGTGDVFIDNTGASFVVNNPRQRVWLRHYNSELGQGAEMVPVEVKAGVVWMLGWKSENLCQRVRVHRDGAMEMVGFNNYEVSTRRKKDGNWPIFEIVDGQFSCNLLVQHGSQRNENLVWETRNGQKRVLDAKSNAGGKNCPLYTGYDPGEAKALR